MFEFSAGARRTLETSADARKRIGSFSTLQWMLGTLEYKVGLSYRKAVKVKPRFVAHPFKLRSATSDSFVFRQIMIENEYAPLKELRPATIVDLGANIGLASICF